MTVQLWLGVRECSFALHDDDGKERATCYSRYKLIIDDEADRQMQVSFTVTRFVPAYP